MQDCSRYEQILYHVDSRGGAEGEARMTIDRLYGSDPLVWPETRCYGCGRPISGARTWLGEYFGGDLEQWPFHPACADQPWPLFEVRRDVVEEGRRARPA